MASEFVSYVGTLISVRSVVQLYPGPYEYMIAPLGAQLQAGLLTSKLLAGDSVDEEQDTEAHCGQTPDGSRDWLLVGNNSSLSPDACR